MTLLHHHPGICPSRPLSPQAHELIPLPHTSTALRCPVLEGDFVTHSSFAIRCHGDLLYNISTAAERTSDFHRIWTFARALLPPSFSFRQEVPEP